MIRPPACIDGAVKKLTDTINEAKETASQKLNKPRLHRLPSYIKEIIYKRNAARKIYQPLRTSESKHTYYALSKTVRDEIRSY